MPTPTPELSHTTVLRVFRLIRLLATPPHKDALSLSRILGIHKRSVYRYLHLLEGLGYDIECDFQSRYFIPEADPRQPNQFTAEESRLVQQLLAAVPASHPLLHSIKKKVYQTSELTPLVEDLVDLHRAQLVQALARAIAEQRQVRLLQYHSANSSQVSDRLVEPMSFSENYTQLEAYEPESGIFKTFKLQRMEQVELLDTKIQTDPDTQPNRSDAFGFSGEPFEVVLHLSLRAYRLLIEEFPVLRPYAVAQVHDRFPYRFEGHVNSEVGLGRFILGLPGEIEVERPQRLTDYLNGRIAGVRW